MNEINFLPESFFKERARRRRTVRDALLLMLVAAGLAAWGVLGHRSLQGLRQFADQLETEGDSAREQVKEVVKLQGEFQKLTKTLQVQRDVALPVTSSALLATITHLMPPDVVLSELSLDAKKAMPTKAEESDKEKKASKKAPVAKKGVPAPSKNENNLMRIELSGLSPDDARIADFVGRLSDCPAFSNVKLEFTRAAEIEEMTGRQFRISLAVRIDREYRPTADRENVAHAN